MLEPATCTSACYKWDELSCVCVCVLYFDLYVCMYVLVILIIASPRAAGRCWRQTQQYCSTPTHLQTFSNLYRLSHRRQQSNGLHASMGANIVQYAGYDHIHQSLLKSERSCKKKKKKKKGHSY